MKSRLSLKKIGFHAFVLSLSLLFILPLFWMISSSFKTEQQIYSDMTSLRAFFPSIKNFTIKPYTELLGSYNIFRNMLNSLFYSVITVASSLVINSLAGYALAKMKLPFKKIFMIAIVGLIIVPTEATILPMYLIVNRLGLVNTIPGVILPFSASVMSIFLYRQYFLKFPTELIEAGKIDGLSSVQIFFRIVVPVSIPIYITTGVLAFLASWNDFLWPVMVISRERMMPIQVALSAIFADRENIFTNHMMAGLTLATIPVILIYLIFQKYIVQGIATTGSKG
ncbi:MULTISPECIES: carbohydrate ABC transporter permease [unclassified Cetobacterium]|uniref:carbohydrate ABC transporter permease n=1 Tax=unclassified Cetobacterium TaxID=2630983 RepID=UPI000647AD0A|nr:carbohydrate ABC transporter permease [Cetobacterium sp. ZOR0034]